MLYQVYLQNGPFSPWLALQTRNENEAILYFESAKAHYVYLRILNEKGWLVSLRCEKRYTNGL